MLSQLQRVLVVSVLSGRNVVEAASTIAIIRSAAIRTTTPVPTPVVVVVVVVVAAKRAN